MNKHKNGFLFTVAFIFLFSFLGQTEAYTGSISISSDGGNCSLVGSWDNDTKTCTLTDDIDGSINISGSSLTLDGNDHILKQTGRIRTGLDIGGSGILIKNLTVKGFTNNIILGAGGSTLDHVTSTNFGSYGVYMTGANNTVTNSIISTGYLGIWTNSSGHTISNNTISNIDTYGIRLYFQKANHILIQNNLIEKNNYFGIFSQYAENNTIKGNTFKNNKSFAYYENNNGYTGNVIVQNNFIDNDIYNEGQINYWTDGTLSQDLPVGGNYWSDYDTATEGCDDTDNNGVCDTARSGYPFSVSTDYYPWKTENGWKVKPEPAQFYAEIKNTDTFATLRENPTSSSNPIKTLPNNWVVYIESKVGTDGIPVESDGFIWYKVFDPTDSVIGWMPAKSSGGIVYLSYEKDKQSIFETKSKTSIDTKTDRSNAILEAVNHYFGNADTGKSLYSSDDHSLKISTLVNKNFPKEVYLAILAQESGSINFDNEYVTFDYGHGISQVTMDTRSDYKKNKYDPRGILSDVSLSKCSNFITKSDNSWLEGSNEYKKCFNPVYNSAGKLYKQTYGQYDDVATNPTYKNYTNTKQSIYANIKDGLGVLESKDSKAFPSNCKNSLSVGGLTISCTELNIIKTVWGYNGFAKNSAGEYIGTYMKDVAGRLANLSSYFANTTYANTDNLIEKLLLANKHKKEIRVHSPVALQVLDSSGNITGLSNGQIKGDIANSVYDEDTESVALFFPDNTYTYRVVGDGTGDSYGIEVVDTSDDAVNQFLQASNIPISKNEIHTYHIDEQKILAGGKGVTLDIDTNGDSVVDRTLVTGSTFDDITPPVIMLGSTINDTYTLGSTITISATATDNKDPNPSIKVYLDTTEINFNQSYTLSSIGNHTVKIEAIDATGNTAVVVKNIAVRYVFGGFEQPVKDTSEFNLKRTVPVKWTLIDTNNSQIHNISGKITFVKNDSVVLEDAFAEVGSSGVYKYNLQTSDLGAGNFVMNIKPNDGSVFSKNIVIK